jgi:hypothetical protein
VGHQLDRRGIGRVVGVGFGGCCGRCPGPSPRLCLASNRVCPNILYPSLWGRGAGLLMLRSGVVPKEAASSPRPLVSSPQAAGVVTSLRGSSWPAAMAACQPMRLVTTTHSHRSRAAARAVRAWAGVSWWWVRLVRWAWRAASTGLWASAPQVARQAASRRAGRPAQSCGWCRRRRRTGGRGGPGRRA